MDEEERTKSMQEVSAERREKTITRLRAELQRAESNRFSVQTDLIGALNKVNFYQERFHKIKQATGTRTQMSVCVLLAVRTE